MVVKFVPFTRKDLIGILHKKAFYETERNRLAKRAGAQDRYRKTTSAAGIRRAGGGRHDEFKEFKVKLLQHAQVERQYGHTLTRDDLWREFSTNID